MKPIAAAECYFVPDRNPELKDKSNYHLVLIAKDMVGLRQLNSILSEANISGYYVKARVDFDLLSRLDPAHFLCTTACVGGVLKAEDGEQMCLLLHEIFKENFYLEIQHHPQAMQVAHNQKILGLYKKYGWKLIYGTDSHYVYPTEKMLRKELLLSANITYEYEDDFDLYLPTAEQAFQMLSAQNVFSKAQIEEAMDNTLQLRDFEGVHFSTEKKIPNSKKNLTLDQRNYLYKKEVCDGYLKKAGMPSKEEAAALHTEMDAVADTGTADYFICMKDIVDKGTEYGGILTRTGRGSGVSFATNYALGFTSINRLRCPVKLYPERFISKERLASGALPDLDLNMSGVDAFERAGKEILGEYGCLPMVAFGTAKTLAAFKLLARARNLDFDTSNNVSKQIKAYEADLKHAKENNADDPDYDAEDDVPIERYVDAQYLGLIEDSKQYKGIVTSISPHPCAHLLLDKDIREEIGVIRLKAKTGKKEVVLAAYIDGQTADTYGYLKADFLRVDVVKTIAQTFAAIHEPILSVDELLNRVKDDNEVWSLYASGFTMGLNQCEQAKTTQRVMRYKPKNIVELAAFVAAVRPGFKSMLETFISRTKFSYGIPSLDSLLQTDIIPDSFLMYDEQILTILQQGGIPAADAYVCVKAIKKKKADKVASFKQRFEKGFSAYLIAHENADEESAKRIVEKIWTIINDAASYMFCAAHAYSMACDSLYAAYLKVHHPYEFYVTMLDLYDLKGRKDKISQIISEMKRYRGIEMRPGCFGQDNRSWLIDKEAHSISQSLSAMKYVSKGVADALYRLKDETYETFSDLLLRLTKATSIDARQQTVLIGVGYFRNYGEAARLWAIYQNFLKGKNRITKQLKDATVAKRISALRLEESEINVPAMNIGERLRIENEYIGLCLTQDATQSDDVYFVQNVEEKYGIKLTLYSPHRGTSGVMRISKSSWAKSPLAVGELIRLNSWRKQQRSVFTNGKRTAIPGEFDLWIDKFERVPYNTSILDDKEADENA